MKPLILASGSPYRRSLLERLMVSFAVRPPQVDEEELKESCGLSPRETACFLARTKARSLSEPGSIVIGGDQLVAKGSAILGKPKTHKAAHAQLERLQGQSHELVTATCIVGPDGQLAENCNITTLTMRPLSASQIERYLQRDQPFDCAGSYKYELSGIALFDRIDCEDETAIQGLPLLFVARTLNAMGLPVP